MFVDFLVDLLWEGLLAAAAALDVAARRGETVYLYCMVGMGWLLGLVIVYMYWFLDVYDSLDGVYEVLMLIWFCGFKKELIRAATCDIFAAYSDEWLIKFLE